MRDELRRQNAIVVDHRVPGIDDPDARPLSTNGRCGREERPGREKSERGEDRETKGRACRDTTRRAVRGAGASQ
jgi:hypothetical protein